MGNLDPYLILNDEFLTCPDDWSPVTELDIVQYLVYSENPLHSMEEMKTSKGLAASNQATSGWVREVRVAIVDDYAVIRGKVCNLKCCEVLCFQTATSEWVIV